MRSNPESPTLDHSNRKAYNRLFYEIGDKNLVELRGYLRGHLYDLGCGEMAYRDWLLKVYSKP